MREYKGFRDLIVFQKSYNLALKIFKITKSFPKEERYSLIDQIRRSSRSVPSNIAEAWSKRRYPKSFVSKLIDCLGEASETEVWLDMSFDLDYISKIQHSDLMNDCHEIEKMLNSMINHPEKFCH
ncbi:MAG: diversity-generating retroelement protein bAvd family protein [Candidatus Cloacimonadota bacterium]|nr:MAG: diversity-generating retroelement protein bAvd family protein [Candidatus Cloacimonadota bacterium]